LPPVRDGWDVLLPRAPTFGSVDDVSIKPQAVTVVRRAHGRLVEFAPTGETARATDCCYFEREEHGDLNLRAHGRKGSAVWASHGSGDVLGEE
jgi:hypothetical protein